jgi:hypothetical protein
VLAENIEIVAEIEFIHFLFSCHSERSPPRRTKSKNLRSFTSEPNYMRSFDCVFLRSATEDSAQDDRQLEQDLGKGVPFGSTKRKTPRLRTGL